MSVEAPSIPPVSRREVRVVIEAQCSLCGSMVDETAQSILQAAKAHTAVTGHVVILNGTVDLFELEECASS